MRRFLSPALFALSLLAPSLVFAQDNPDCPPGAWFCEETESPGAAEPDFDDGEGEGLDEPELPPPPRVPPQRRGRTQKAPPGSTTVIIPPPPTDGRRAQPPIVIYQPIPEAPSAEVVVVTPPPRAPSTQVREVPPPPPKSSKRKRIWNTHWGLNLRLEGVAMGRNDGAAENAGMGGIGASLRFRPVPSFAIDAGIDMLGGTDYNGLRRAEVPLSLSGILYVNPRSKVQFYLIGGADWSHATVESDVYHPLLAEGGGYSTEYTYFGGHGGVGLEFRLSRLIGLNIDGLGFVRSRTDGGRIPEFIDYDTGRSTDTSGGGLLRGGINFWW